MGWDQHSESPLTPLDWDSFVGRRSASESRSPGVQSAVSDMDAGSRWGSPSMSRAGSEMIEWMSDEAISERASRWGNRVAEAVIKNSRRQSTSSFGSARSSCSSSRSRIATSDSVSSSRLPDSLESALSSIRLAFMVCDATDPETRILYASSGFPKLTGYSPEEAVGRTCWFLLEDGTGADSDKIAEIQSALRRGDPYCGTMVNYRKDGAPFWNLLNLSPISDADGVVIKYFGMLTEVDGLPKMSHVRSDNALTTDAGLNQGILASLVEDLSMSALRPEIDITGTEERFTDEDDDYFPVFQMGAEEAGSSKGDTGTEVSDCSAGKSIKKASERYSLYTRPIGRRVMVLDGVSEGEVSRRHSNRYSLTISPRRSMEFRSRRSMVLCADSRPSVDLNSSDRWSMDFCSNAWRSNSQRFTIPVLERDCSIGTYLAVMPPEVREWYYSMAKKSLVAKSNFALQDVEDVEASNSSPSPKRSRPLIWFLAAERSAEIEETGIHSEDEESRETSAAVSSQLVDGERKTVGRREAIRMWKTWMLRMRIRSHSKVEFTRTSVFNSMPQLTVLSFRSKSRALTKFYHSDVRPRWTGLIKAAQNQVASARQSVSYILSPDTQTSRQIVLVYG